MLLSSAIFHRYIWSYTRIKEIEYSSGHDWMEGALEPWTNHHTKFLGGGNRLFFVGAVEIIGIAGAALRQPNWRRDGIVDARQCEEYSVWRGQEKDYLLDCCVTVYSTYEVRGARLAVGGNLFTPGCTLSEFSLAVEKAVTFVVRVSYYCNY